MERSGAIRYASCYVTVFRSNSPGAQSLLRLLLLVANKYNYSIQFEKLVCNILEKSSQTVQSQRI